jgi:hypothetical protein
MSSPSAEPMRIPRNKIKTKMPIFILFINYFYS